MSWPRIDEGRVLVLSPHPDDETLGCGGTIRVQVLGGAAVLVVFLSDGEAGGHGADLTAELRCREAASALQILGVTESERWSYPDGGLTPDDASVGRLRTLIEDWRPTVVYAPHAEEDHPDHRATARMAMAACAGTVPALGYEVWTPLARVDDVVDITEVVDTKRQAIRAYESQTAFVDFEDAMVALARYRGALSLWTDGQNTGLYAEAFRSLT